MQMRDSKRVVSVRCSLRVHCLFPPPLSCVVVATAGPAIPPVPSAATAAMTAKPLLFMVPPSVGGLSASDDSEIRTASRSMSSDRDAFP